MGNFHFYNWKIFRVSQPKRISNKFSFCQIEKQFLCRFPFFWKIFLLMNGLRIRERIGMKRAGKLVSIQMQWEKGESNYRESRFTYPKLSHNPMKRKSWNSCMKSYEICIKIVNRAKNIIHIKLYTFCVWNEFKKITAIVKRKGAVSEYRTL